MKTGTPPSDIPPRLGAYHLIAERGRGAMGVVYEARKDGLDRRVAVKIVAAGRLASADELKRFRTEASAASRLSHPGIVPVHDVGEQDGQHYLVMEFLPGPSLAERLKDGPFEAREAARIVRELAEALEFAHGRGVIHRDVKPANVILDADGRPILTDFGLARTLDDESSLTVYGAPIGSPAYMSPEQAEGRTDRIGPRTDVHALGAVLYALMTGRPPYATATAVATLQMVRERDPVPPRTLDPSLPVDLETICLKALQKDPARRYSTAGDLSADLRRWLDGEPIEARPVGCVERLVLAARRHPRVATLVVAVALVSVTAAAAVTWQWRVAVDALARADQARTLRLRSKVEALGTVEPHGFLSQLAAIPRDADPIIDDALREASRSEDERVQFRARLARLARSPESIADEDASLFFEAPDAFERAHAIAVVRGAVAAVPPESARPLLESIESRVRDRDADAARRATALALGFAFDVGTPEDEPDLAVLARSMVDVDPFYLTACSYLLDPLPPALQRELERIVRDGDDTRRRQATSLLCRAFSADPRPLLALVGSLGPEALALVAKSVRDHPAAAAFDERLHELVVAPAEISAKRVYPDVPPGAAERLAAFAGVIAPQTAYAWRVPPDELRPLIDGLSVDGYRPTRVRPRLIDGELRYLVSWVRDAAPFDWITDATREAVLERAADRSGTLAALDVSSIVVDGALRHTAVFGPPPKGVLDSALVVGLGGDEYADAEARLVARGFVPTTFHVASSGDDYRVSLTFHAHDVFAMHVSENFRLNAEGTNSPFIGFDAVDVAYIHMTEGGPLLSGLVTPRSDAETRVVAAPTEERHADRARALLMAGFTIHGLSVKDGEDEVGAASVWKRPTPSTSDLIRRGRRAAEAATLLAYRGEIDPALILLDSAERPEARAQLTSLLPNSGLPATRLVDALDTGAPPQTIALLRTLGRYGPEKLTQEARHSLERAALGLATSDDDGIRNAARWCLRAFGIDEGTIEEPQIDSESNGHRLIDIHPGAASPMGSTRLDPWYEAGERPHMVTINRHFALSECETTFAQFTRFLMAHPKFERGVRGPLEHPAERVSWFQAVAYCRWLSELAGLPEDEMCYPPIGEVLAAWDQRRPPQSLTLPDDFLEREGFRLPTEREWEFACRAGSRTSRWFGDDDRLLPVFTTCRDNGARRRAVATAPPNDLGLFDMLGSLFEWCQGPEFDYPIGRTAFEDRLFDDGKEYRTIRGGSYDMPAYRLRSAARLESPPSATGVGLGFRVARTR